MGWPRHALALEGTDARALGRTAIGEEVSAIVADVSFIGLALAFPAALRLAAPGAWLDRRAGRSSAKLPRPSGAAAASRNSLSAPVMEREVEIARVGARGDGVAEGAFALPGERVRVAVTPGDDRAELLAVLRPSPERVASVCRHFGVCGGCALQHLEGAAYLAWKHSLVVARLCNRGG